MERIEVYPIFDRFCEYIDHYDGELPALDHVTEGRHLAFVGNNGYARNPHIHLGAFRDGKPLAISFDPQKAAGVAGRVGKCHWRFGISDQEYIEKYKKQGSFCLFEQ